MYMQNVLYAKFISELGNMKWSAGNESCRGVLVEHCSRYAHIVNGAHNVNVARTHPLTRSINNHGI